MTEYDQYLDWIANGRDGAMTNITLNVSGQLVTGFPVMQDEYMRGVGEELTRISLEGGEINQATADEMASEDYSSLLRRVFGTTTDNMSQDKCIHLKEVTIIGAGESVVHTEWWRGRLSAVDGFSFGAPNISA